MIGDSWVGMRTGIENSHLQQQLTELTGFPTMVWTKGTGGAKSRDIYLHVFDKNGTRPLMEEGPDFCAVFAGINDASANLGTTQFRHHFKLILQFLLKNDICPIVVEIPDVNIWTVKNDKPLKDLAGDYVKSIMTGCDMYCYANYREELNKMLIQEELLDEVVFVPIKEWCGNEVQMQEMFLDDMIHLNEKGYVMMDSCIAVKIVDYLKKR